MVGPFLLTVVEVVTDMHVLDPKLAPTNYWVRSEENCIQSRLVSARKAAEVQRTVFGQHGYIHRTEQNRNWYAGFCNLLARQASAMVTFIVAELRKLKRNQLFCHGKSNWRAFSMEYFKAGNRAVFFFFSLFWLHVEPGNQI